MCLSEPVFESYGPLVCMETFAKLIIGVRVWIIVSLC